MHLRLNARSLQVQRHVDEGVHGPDRWQHAVVGVNDRTSRLVSMLAGTGADKSMPERLAQTGLQRTCGGDAYEQACRVCRSVDVLIC